MEYQVLVTDKPNLNSLANHLEKRETKHRIPPSVQKLKYKYNHVEREQLCIDLD